MMGGDGRAHSLLKAGCLDHQLCISAALDIFTTTQPAEKCFRALCALAHRCGALCCTACALRLRW